MKSKCPWCNSEMIQTHLCLKDEFLTKEDFQIQACQNCGLLFTEPRPKPEEIGKYYESDEYYSHQENKEGFIPKLYEKIKSINLKNKYKMATEGMEVGKALDIGCGVGDYIHTLEKNGWECLGVEPSEEAKAIAKKRIKATIFSSEEQENLPDNSFDLITMWHVLEHVDNLKWQVKQIERLVKHKGRIVIALPNYKSYDGQYYEEKWAAYDVPRHLNHFNKETLVNIFTTNNLTYIRTDKLIWDAYYISYISETYKENNIPLIRGALQGLKSNLKARKSGEWSSLVYLFEKR